MKQKYCYVFGNDWGLNLLSKREVDFLNSEDCVFAWNLYPEYWEKIGMLPTHWGLNDTAGNENLPFFEDQLKVIKNNKTLKTRLKHVILPMQSDEGLEILNKYMPFLYKDICVTLCHTKGETVAKTLGDKMFCRNSSITVAINLASILTNRTIKLFGASYDYGSSHFYDESENLGNRSVVSTWSRIWDDIELVGESIPIIDCTRGNLIRNNKIPKGTILEDGWTLFLNEHFSSVYYEYDGCRNYANNEKYGPRLCFDNYVNE